MKILIKNGRVIDPDNKLDQVMDILVDAGKISKVAKGIKDSADTVIDATGKIVMPGLVDMHVHLREPGREDKETIDSGTMAALKGGVTTLLAMPNTEPCIDNARISRLVQEIARASGHANVLFAGAITKARRGEELTNSAELKSAGIIALTDDGCSVDSEELMLEALKSSRKQKLLVICHSQDRLLSGAGAVNLGFTSTCLGLRGISAESEYKRVARDIQLAEQANAPVHIAHVSCQESVEIIAKAKKKGSQVSAETAPHYFALDESAVLGYDTNYKMNPPLRNKDDVAAVREGLREGVIDAIASDHAPHTENEKAIEFERAEFGVTGLETELAVSISTLVEGGVLSWPQLVERLALAPARILRVNKGSLGEGCDADIIVVDPDMEWVVKKEDFLSKSKNSAFLGQKLKGIVAYTLYAGEIVYKNGIYR